MAKSSFFDGNEGVYDEVANVAELAEEVSTDAADAASSAEAASTSASAASASAASASASAAAAAAGLSGEYLVKSGHPSLTDERVVGDLSSPGGIIADWSVAGQVKFKQYASAANKIIYSTGATAWEETTITAAGRALINSTVTADASGNVSGVNQLTTYSRITAFADTSAQALDMIARSDNIAQFRFLNNAVSDVQAALFSTSTDFLIYAQGSRSITFRTNEVDRMHVTSGGKITLGSSTVATSAAAVDGGIQVRSNASPFPSTGKGVEITYPSGSDIGHILSYDRDGSAFKPLWIDSSALTLNQSVGGPIYCKGQFGLAEYTVGTAPTPAANNLYITVTDLDTTVSGTAISGHGGGSNKRICISASGAWYVY